MGSWKKAMCLLGLVSAPLAGQTALFTYPDWGRAAALGDVDGDGVRDLLSGDGTTAFVLSGRDGTLLRALPTTSTWGGFPTSPVGDLDGDGTADVALGGAATLDAYSGRTGTLLYSINSPIASYGTAVAGLDDIDGDGRADLLVSWELFAASLVEVRSGGTGATLATVAGAAAVFAPTGLGDVDGDGIGDYAVGWEQVWPTQERVQVYSGRTRTLIRTHTQEGLTVGSFGSDLDGDGADEYLLSHWTKFTGTWVELVSGATGLRVNSWTCANAGSSAGDFDGDGTEDIAAGTCGALRVWSGATFATIATIPGSFYVQTRPFADVDFDGRSELLVLVDGRGGSASTAVWSNATVDFVGAPNAGVTTAAQTQQLTLNAPPQHAGKAYWILGSLSGTAPGFGLLGRTVPLNLDAYTLVTARSPHVVLGGTGTLSATAQATAQLNVPPLPPTVVGVTVHHAYVVLGSGSIDYVSRPQPLAFVR